MAEQITEASAQALPDNFNDMASYRAALLRALQQASRTVDWFDASFADTEIQTIACVEQIQRLLSESKISRLRLLLLDGEFLCQKSPRLVPVLERYGHACEIRRVRETSPIGEDCFLIADTCVVRRFSRAQARGNASFDSRNLVQCRHRFEEIWAESELFTDWRRLHL